MKSEIFLLLGPEIGEKRNFIDQYIDQLSKKLSNPPEVSRFYPGEKDIREFLGEISTGSLFSEYRVFILERVDEYSKANQIKPLVEMLQSPPDSCSILLTSDKNSVDRKISGVFPKNNKKNFWEMFEGAKKSWIQSYFRQKKIQIHQDAMEELLDMVENNTSEMRTACETLTFYFSEGQIITSEDIDRILYHSKEENVFTLFEKIAHRDLEASLEVFGKIRLSQQSESVGLLAGLLWQMKLLLSLAVLREKGYSDSECWKELKLHGKKRQKLYALGCSRYRRDELQNAISLIAKCDYELRSVRKEMQDRIMELFLYKLIRRKV